jgi:CheY-like chemotaxis protein
MMTPKTGWILWVEDDDQVARDLQLVWRPPVPVHRVAGTAEALGSLENTPPELVLLDLHLPHFLAQVDEEEGLALLQNLRSRLSRDLPVVVLTQAVSPDSRARALALGADAFLSKPITVGELEGVVRVLLDRPG